ncbi:MAG: outer membrane protein [Chakrabartia sp.]
MPAVFERISNRGSSVRIHSKSLLFCVALLPMPALAAPGTGPYVEIAAGGSWAENLNFKVTTNTGTVSKGLVATHKSGNDLSIALGQDFGLIRIEAELSQRETPVGTLTAPATAKIPIGYVKGATTPVLTNGTFSALSGTTRSRSAMINAYAQYNLPGDTRVFIGGGIGYDRTYAHAYAAKTASTVLVSTSEVVRDHDDGLAWQGIIGAREPIGDHVTIGLRYRYYHARYVGVTDTLNRGLVGKLSMQSVQATLGYRF